MPSKWDSGIVVWAAGSLYGCEAGDRVFVLKEGADGVYLVDPNQKGRPVVYRFGTIRYAEDWVSDEPRTGGKIGRAAVGAAIGGLAGAVWLGLRPASRRVVTLKIMEDSGTSHLLRCRTIHDARRMEKRIMRNHAIPRQPEKQPPTPAEAQPKKAKKRNAPPEPPVGYTGR